MIGKFIWRTALYARFHLHHTYRLPFLLVIDIITCFTILTDGMEVSLKLPFLLVIDIITCFTILTDGMEVRRKFISHHSGAYH